MAYSRWGTSDWYTYWSDGDSDGPPKRDTQVFEICALTRFTYKDLKEDIEGCITKAAKIATKLEGKTPSQKSLAELRAFMGAFMVDVEADPDLMDPLYNDLKKVAEMSNALDKDII